MRSCPVLANITRCPQTRRAPSVQPGTTGPERGKDVRTVRLGLFSWAEPGRSSTRGRESRRATAAPPWTFIEGWGEGKLGFRQPGATPRTYGKGLTKGEPGALASPQHLLQTPVSWCGGPLRSARGAGDPCRCKPCRVGGCRPGFVFNEINQSAKLVLLRGMQRQAV